MNSEKSGHVLQPTALVNVAYLKPFELQNVLVLQGLGSGPGLGPLPLTNP